MIDSRRNQVFRPLFESGDAAVRDEGRLPTNWLSAIEALEQGTILPGYLGEDFIRVFASCRRHERLSFEANVTPLEIEWYLRTV